MEGLASEGRVLCRLHRRFRGDGHLWRSSPFGVPREARLCVCVCSLHCTAHRCGSPTNVMAFQGHANVTPRRARARAVPCLPTLGTDGCQSWGGYAAGRLEASRKLPSAMGLPLRDDGRPGSSGSPNGCALHTVHGTEQPALEDLQERFMEAMETFFASSALGWWAGDGQLGVTGVRLPQTGTVGPLNR